ncbi:MAG: MMPL family transporter [Bacteroidota bacterium]
MHNIFVNIHRLISKGKIASIIFLIAIISIAAFYAYNIKLEEDVTSIIPRDERINKINEVFSQSKFADRIIFIISLDDKEASAPNDLITAADFLVSKLQTDSTHIKSVSSKMESAAFQHVYDFIYNNLPLFLSEEDYKEISKRIEPKEVEKTLKSNFKTLISPVGFATKEYLKKDPLHLTSIALKKLENFQLDENFHIYNSSIFTKDNKNLLVFLEPEFPSSNTSENKHLINFIEKSIADFESNFDEINVEYYGGTAVAVANANRIKADIILTVSIALIVLSFFFLLIFRKLKYIILLFAPILFGVLISVAALVIIKGTVSAMALGVGAVLIGISLDYSLHAFTHFRSSNSVIHTLSSISKPVIMSSVSTALAFLCLFIVKSEALNQLGLFAAIAILGTALIVLTVVPFFLKSNKNKKAKNRITFLDKISLYDFHKKKYLIFAILLLSAVFAYTSGKLDFNSDLSSLNYQPEHLAKTEKKLKEISSEAFSAVYLVTQAKKLDSALSLAEKNIEILQDLKKDGIVSDISSATDLMFSAEKQKQKIERWNNFWDSNKKETLQKNLIEKGAEQRFNKAAFTEFFNLLNKDFKKIENRKFSVLQDNFLDNYISESDSLFSVISIIKVDQNKKNQLFEAFENNNEVIIFDNQFFINRFLDVLKEDFRWLVLLSMILIFGILLVSYGRIELAIIGFVPILLSWLWTIGLMGLLGIKFNIFNIIITTFVFGLGVDYSIFIMSGLINNHKYGKTSLAPYKLSVLLSAITTVTSFGVLIFAQHPVLKSIAVVSILGISSVIIITYTLLPLFFNYLVKNKGRDRVEPITIFNMTVSINALFTFLLGVTIMGFVFPILITAPIRTKFKKKVVHQIICKFSKFITSTNHGVSTKFINKEKLDFSKPSVIISNHQSYIDLMFLLGLHPKTIAFTNSWVYNSIFFGYFIRYANFYPAFKGLNHDFLSLKEKINEGYSVLIFPEGTRSENGEIKRFHQGAFYVADKLNLDIQPIMIHGLYHAMPKDEFFLKSGHVTIKVLDKIKVKPVNTNEGETYREQAKALTAIYRKEFDVLRSEIESPKFYASRVKAQYIYKGPVLEWYVKTKLKAEEYYTFYNKIIPQEADILDIGCGYGYMAYMLHCTSNKRKITGIDYDEEKIAIAKKIASKTNNLDFNLQDITEGEIPQADVFILNDVLHYLPKDLRIALLDKCVASCRDQGMIIIRDADTDIKNRTFFTKFTEIQSTQIMRFNKKKYKLSFFPGKEIENFAYDNGLLFERHDKSRLTSNITYILRKQKNE